MMAAVAQRFAPQAGDAAFAAAVEEHHALLHAMARRLCGEGAEAQDLVQDTLERALRAHDRLAPDSNLRAWLVTILHNVFVDRCRRRRRQGDVVPLDDGHAVSPPAPPPEPPWYSIGGDDVARALDQLDEEFRVIYRLHAIEGRPYADIAEQLGIPKATVGTRLLRARRKLREILGRQLSQEDG